MKLTIDTSGKRFTVTRKPEAKTDGTGQPRLDKPTGLPLWSTQMVVVDEEGGDIIAVTTVGTEPPDFLPDDPVRVIDLVAMPWVSNGRSGVAYRATNIIPDED